jgi:hypothetical protein
MSENDNSNKFNNEAADALADAVRFAPGSTYASTQEYYRDARSPRYKSDALYRQQCDEKLDRSQVDTGNHKVIDNQGGYRSAAAINNADGKVESFATNIFEPNGKPTGEPQPRVEDGPVFRTMPGGVQRVSVSSSHMLPKLPEKK